MTASPPASAAGQQQDLCEGFLRVFVDPVLLRVVRGSQAKAGARPGTPSRSASKHGEAAPAPPKPLPACPMPDLFEQVPSNSYHALRARGPLLSDAPQEKSFVSQQT